MPFVGPEDKEGGGKVNISKCSFLLTAYISADCMFEFGFLKHVLFGVSVSALCN